MGVTGRGRGLARGAVCCVIAAAVMALGVPVVAASVPPAQSGKPLDPSSLPPISAPNGTTTIKPQASSAGDFALPSTTPGQVAPVTGSKATAVFDPATEITSARTATSQVSVAADGTHVLRLFAQPHFFDTGKGFSPIDSTVAADPAHPGALVSKANSWQVSFAPLGEGGVTVVNGTKTMTFVPDGATDVAPVVGTGANANTVTYAGAWPGADLVYHVAAEAVKEEIVLHDNTRSSFSFSVPDSQLTPAAGAPGQAGALARTDQATGPNATMSIAAPVVKTATGAWVDSAKPAQQAVAATTAPGADQTAGTGTTSGTSQAAVGTPAPTGSDVKVSVDPAWLGSLTKKDFPVIIDPTVVMTGGSSDGWASYRSNGTTSCGPYLATYCDPLVGSDGTSFWRTAIHFPYESYLSAHPGAHVTNAVLHLWNGPIYDTNTQEVDVWHAACLGYTCEDPGPLNDALYGVSFNYFSGNLGTQGNTAPIGIGITALYDWMFASGTTNRYLLLSGDEFPGQNTLKDMGASLDLTVDNAPAASTPATPNDQSVTSSLTPTLTANSVTDPDGDTPQYDIVVGTAPGATGQLWESGFKNGPAGLTATIDPGVLQDGRTYYWRVDTKDPWLTTTGTTVRSFHVNRRLGQDPTQPLDTVGPVTVNAANGNLVTSIAPYPVSTLGGTAGVQLTYNSQAVPATNGLTGRYWAVDPSATTIPLTSPTLTRTDPQVFFNWGTGAPSPSLPSDNFMAQWKGTLTVPTTGTYKLGTWTDDGAKLILYGTTLTDTWTTNNPNVAAWSGNVSLTAGTAYPIEMDYREAVSTAAAALLVQGTGITGTATVPTSWLSVNTRLGRSAGGLAARQRGSAAWQRAIINTGSVILVDPTGDTAEYKWNGSGYTPPPGEDGVMTPNISDGTINLQDTDGMTYVFDGAGNLVLRNLRSGRSPPVGPAVLLGRGPGRADDDHRPRLGPGHAPAPPRRRRLHLPDAPDRVRPGCYGPAV